MVLHADTTNNIITFNRFNLYNFVELTVIKTKCQNIKFTEASASTHEREDKWNER